MASELTAARQEMRKTNCKLEVVQHQMGDLQKQFTGMQDQLSRMETRLQRFVNSLRRTTEPAVGRGAPNLRPPGEPTDLLDLVQLAELEMEMTRRLEDLRQIVATGWEQDQLPNVSTPEGNFSFPSTGFSVVATGWDQDPSPHSSLASPTWNHQKPNQQVNFNPSNDMAPSFFKSLAKGPILDSPEIVGGEPLVEAVAKKMESTMKSFTQGVCKYCGYKWVLGHRCKQNQQVNLMVGNFSAEAQFDLAKLHMGERVDKFILTRSTGLRWNLPPWPGFCAMVSDCFAQPEDLALKVESAFYFVGALIISDSPATVMSSLLVVQKDLPIQHILPRRRIVVSRQGNHKVPVDVIYLTLRISQDDFPQYEEFKHNLIEVVTPEKPELDKGEPPPQSGLHKLSGLKLVAAHMRSNIELGSEPFDINEKYAILRALLMVLLNMVGRDGRVFRSMGLLWNLPPWSDLSFCEVHWRAMGMEKGAGAVSRRNAYNMVAGQGKNQFQPTRNKPFTDDTVLKKETASKLFIPVNSSLYWSLTVICYPGDVETLIQHNLYPLLINRLIDGEIEVVLSKHGYLASCVKLPSLESAFDVSSLTTIAVNQAPPIELCDGDPGTLSVAVWSGFPDNITLESLSLRLLASSSVVEGPVGTDEFMSCDKPTRPVLKVRKPRALVDITPAVSFALLMNELQWIGLIVKPIDCSLKDDIWHLGVGAGLKIQESQMIEIENYRSDREHFSSSDASTISSSATDNGRVEKVPIDTGKIELSDWAIDVITLVGFPIHATDIVLTVTQMLRKHGVVGRFVEFYGEGMGKLSLVDRAAIANMSPEYVATMGFFPVDHVTLDYLKLTGRSKETVSMVEAYLRANHMFVDYIESIKQTIKTGTNDQKDKMWSILRKLGVTLKTEEKELMDKTLIKSVMQTRLLASNARLDMVIFHLPSPSKVQRYRVENGYEGPLDDIYATAVRNVDPEGSHMWYIFKMIPVSDQGRFFAFGGVFSGKVANGMKVRIRGSNYVSGQKKYLYVKIVQCTKTEIGRNMLAQQRMQQTMLANNAANNLSEGKARASNHVDGNLTSDSQVHQAAQSGGATGSHDGGNIQRQESDRSTVEGGTLFLQVMLHSEVKATLHVKDVWLDLQAGTVIHVNQLKIHCSPKAISNSDLSLVSKDSKLKAEPISVLENSVVTQWLIPWKNLLSDDASRNDADFIKGVFPGFYSHTINSCFPDQILEDKYYLEEEEMSESDETPAGSSLFLLEGYRFIYLSYSHPMARIAHTFGKNINGLQLLC